MRVLSAGVAVLAVAVASTVVLSDPAHADVNVIVVTNADDSGPGSLRDALSQARSTTSDDHITFAPAVTGTIALSSGELGVGVGGASGNLVIEGPGRDALAVDAGGLSRVLSVTGSGGATRPGLTISGLTLTGGFTDDSDLAGGGAIHGTGVDLTLQHVAVDDNRGSELGGGVSLLGGSLTVDSSTITGNSTTDRFADGGGIAVDAGQALGVTVTVTDSTVSGNTSGGDGGGISAEGDAAVTAVHSTVSGNTASYVWRGMEAAVVTGEGGGISARVVTLDGSQVLDNVAGENGGGVDGQRVSATRATIADNVAGGHGGGLDVEGTGPGAGLHVTSSTLTGNRSAHSGGGVRATGDMPAELTLSTISANTAVHGGGMDTSTDVTVDGSIIAMNAGGDLAGDAQATLDHSLVQEFRGVSHVDTGSLTGQDPLLGRLAGNGGPTETSLPAANSPVIDRGESFGETSDQRGSPRPTDDPGVPDATDGSDMGAVELTPTEQAGPPQVASTARPRISGTVAVGRRLHTDGGTWVPAGVTRSYQWFRNGVPIPGATKASYRLTPADHDRNWYGEDLRTRISVRVTATAAGHRAGTALSDLTGFVRRGALKVSRPAVLTGRLRVGATVHARARVRSISPRPAGVAYLWFLDGHHLQRAHRATLELKPWMRGERVRVRIIYRPPAGYRGLVQVVRGRHPVRSHVRE